MPSFPAQENIPQRFPISRQQNIGNWNRIIFLLMIYLDFRQSIQHNIITATIMRSNSQIHPHHSTNLHSRNLSKCPPPAQSNQTQFLSMTSLIKSKANLITNKQNEQANFESKTNQESKREKSPNHLLKHKQKNMLSKEEKIQHLRQEINKDDEQPNTVKFSAKSNLKGNRSNSVRSVFQRTDKEKHPFLTNDECLFSPKILNRSKSLVRKADVSTLLYQDAKRRQQKQLQAQDVNVVRSPKINPNTNLLVIRKILTQFAELVHEEEMDPLTAILILQEIFNIDLNLRKSHAKSILVEKMVGYIAETDGSLIIKREKLRDFIIAVVGGTAQTSCYSFQEKTSIFEEFHYLYKERMTKERKESHEEQFTFKPITLARSSKLAGSFRERTCQQVQSFIQNQQTNYRFRDRSYSIEDIFLINHLKRNMENEKKKMEQQTKQLQKCTFKPDLSNSAASLHLIKKKAKVILKAPSKKTQLKTEQAHDSSAGTGMHPDYFRSNTQHNKNKVRKISQLNLSDVRNVEKELIRMSVARQHRQFENRQMERGYPEGENWNSYQKYMNRKKVENSKRLKGFFCK